MTKDQALRSDGGPKSVSRFEADLLRILWFVLQRGPREQAISLLQATAKRPPCLSRDAVELIKDALSKGCVILLARNGGWRRERRIRNEEIREGRLWELTDPEDLAFSFSRQAMELLMWLTACNPKAENHPCPLQPASLTLGDRLLMFYVYESLRSTEFTKPLRKSPAYYSDPL
ncbi:MAG: hypothetical protein N2C14_03360, partial [Planctomycetales bacterium]